MTDSSGDSEGTIKYFPFGSTRSGSVPTDKKFTGQRLDGTGLYYYNARYYDPTIGRFISADTIVPDPANPQSLNRYSYCLNNPLKYVDPSGHAAIAAVLAAVGVSALAVAAVLGAGYLYHLWGVALFEGHDAAVAKLKNDLALLGDAGESISDAIKGAAGSAGEAIKDAAGATWEAMEDAAGAALDWATGWILSKPDIKYPGNDPTKSPGEDWEWKGSGPPESGKGSWVNDSTGEKLHPHFEPSKHGPHWDYTAPDGSRWRSYPDGTWELVE